MMAKAPFSRKRKRRSGPLSWRVRLALGLLILLAVSTVWVTNVLLSDRFTQTTRNRAELRLALYSGNILSELRRNAIVPQLLARDPALIGALNSADFSQSSQRLISYVDEIGAASLVLLDEQGAGHGARIAVSEGPEASNPFRPELKPIDAYNAAILDSVGVAITRRRGAGR